MLQQVGNLEKGIVMGSYDAVFYVGKVVEGYLESNIDETWNEFVLRCRKYGEAIQAAKVNILDKIEDKQETYTL